MTSVVFAGPSLYSVDLSSYSELDLRPPAVCGDILRAVKQGASAIGLIDGLFENTASVWHKEILFALAAGVRVLGASSIGALRAAECHHFGMEGVGSVFSDYLSGKRFADADVAVLHAPAELGFKPITEALVDAEATIERLEQLSALSMQDVRSLLSAARAIHYKRRTWPQIIATAGFDKDQSSRARTAILTHAVSQKAEDAKTLLERISNHGRPMIDSRINPTLFSRTVFFALLERRQ